MTSSFLKRLRPSPHIQPVILRSALLRASRRMGHQTPLPAKIPPVAIKFSAIFSGNVSLTLTPPPHLLRRYFQFELSCFHMRQAGQTKREHRFRTVNESLRKALYS
jgi:hypothetical protein